MDDLSNYVIPLDNFDIQCIEDRVIKIGVDDIIKNQLRFLDVSRLDEREHSLIQTIDYAYKRELSVLLYVIQNYTPDKGYYDDILALHNANLEFEKEHPPITYVKKGKVSKEKKVTAPKEKIPKVSKETVKQIKFNKLSFNIKLK